MDEYLRRTAGRIGPSKKVSSLVSRDPKREDKTIQHCNRIGCSTNLNYMKGGHMSNANKLNCSRSSFRSACSKALAKMDDLEKPNCSKTTFRPSCSKALAGSSSASLSNSTVFRKSHREQKSQLSSKSTSVTDSSSAGSSISRQDIQDLDFIDEQEQTQDETDGTTSTTSNFQSLLHGADSLDSTQGCSTSAIGNSISTSRSRRQKPGNINQDTSSSSMRSKTSKLVSQTPGAKSQRYGLKNLGCTSISDVLPSSCSSSDGGQCIMVESVRKRPSEGESSSGRGKGIIGTSNEGRLGSQHSKLSGPSVSTPEHLIAQEGLRNSNKPSSRVGALSVRTRPRPVRETRIRLSERGDNSTPHLDPLVIPQPRVYIQEDVPESPSRSFLLECPPLSHDSFGRRGSSSRSARNRLLTHSEDRGGHHFNMETTAEVLLALERIEQDEDLTFEQLMVLEMNLYLGAVSFHDQHRDLRMDIDNMSYEELLALEEKIGTVSTALSEEALTKCLKRSVFIHPKLTSTVTTCGDDVKCSVCQEDYIPGDEIGSLACEHRYHVMCIHQWLRLKNWCPICKSSAVRC